MARIVGMIVFAIALWICVGGPTTALASPAATACTPAGQCCKVCDKGQACGNSCISRAKECHKGRGCACDLADVCSDGR